MSAINVAIVGCGRISNLHALGYQGQSDARITVVCDTRKRLARDKASAWGVNRIYSDHSAMLNDDDIDLVELLVPHNLHAEMTIAACNAGKHVSVQKSMAMNIIEADQMISSASDAGVHMRIYENFVYYPPFVQAKKLLEAGEISTPQMIRIHVGTGKSDSEWKVSLRS